MGDITYLSGKEPHPREKRLIFKNVDRQGWSTEIECYLKDGGYEQAKKALEALPPSSFRSALAALARSGR